MEITFWLTSSIVATFDCSWTPQPSFAQQHLKLLVQQLKPKKLLHGVITTSTNYQLFHEGPRRDEKENGSRLLNTRDLNGNRRHHNSFYRLLIETLAALKACSTWHMLSGMCQKPVPGTLTCEVHQFWPGCSENVTHPPFFAAPGSVGTGHLTDTKEGTSCPSMDIEEGLSSSP